MTKQVRNGLTQKQRKSRNKRIAYAIDIYAIRMSPPMGRNWKKDPYGSRGDETETASQPTGAVSTGLTGAPGSNGTPEDSQAVREPSEGLPGASLRAIHAPEDTP